MAGRPQRYINPPGPLPHPLPEPQIPNIPVLQSSRENGWTVTRPDGTWIDGRDKGLNAAMFTGLAMQSGSNSKRLCDVSWLSFEWNSQEPPPCVPLNALAMGHLINHPPRHFPPNAAFHSVDVPQDVVADAALRWFVPCVRCSLNDGGGRREEGGGGLPALGVLSTRNIEQGEEVFCDYNFDVDVAPDWYAPVE